MEIDKKILREIERHHKINKYITEQADLALEPADAPATGPETATTPEAPDGPPVKIDVAQDTEVEKIDGEGQSTESSESGTEELEITDLVNSQKGIEKKQDDYFQQLFGYLNNLETKLADMDNLVNKLNSIETKIEKYREKTPQEKLELRSLDSGPFNQKLTDFFDDKKEDFEKAGKHEYVLTSDEIENISPAEIKKTFDKFDDGYENPFKY
jgi:hypothetical protein